MISIVNGYVCLSSCAAAQAKQGKDPHAKPGALGDDQNQSSGVAGQPATLRGGALQDALSADAVGAASGAQPARINLVA
jgi:hypothetical protein